MRFSLTRYDPYSRLSIDFKEFGIRVYSSHEFAERAAYLINFLKAKSPWYVHRGAESDSDVAGEQGIKKAVAQDELHREGQRMGTPSNVKPENRAAALRFAGKALAASEAPYDKWILVESKRPRAGYLKPVNDHLRLLIAMLDDATADHHKVAHDLGVVIAQLMLLDEMAFLNAIMDIERGASADPWLGDATANNDLKLTPRLFAEPRDIVGARW
jgi:hypothetical protein